MLINEEIESVITDQMYSGDSTGESKPVKIRERVLSGKTYKIKSPLYKESFYVTINDLNGKPFEIFINSKNVGAHQWITALTRVMSACFRVTEDPTFLIKELMSVYDSNGGYWTKGTFVPSLVSAIGTVLGAHMGEIELEIVNTGTLCPECNTRSVVSKGGCKVCENCGESKCE